MKIKTGTLVKIKKPLSDSWRKDEIGIIDHNYAERYGGTAYRSYAIRFFNDDNIGAWYTAKNLEVLDTENLYCFQNKKLYKLQEIDKKNIIKQYTIEN